MPTLTYNSDSEIKVLNIQSTSVNQKQTEKIVEEVSLFQCNYLIVWIFVPKWDHLTYRHTNQESALCHPELCPLYTTIHVYFQSKPRMKVISVEVH